MTQRILDFRKNGLRGPKAGRWAVALFFVLLTVLGLWANGGYGLPCDEQWEQQTLLENAYEYALLLGGENSPAARYYAEKGLTRISESTERDHGQSAYYPLIPLMNSDLPANTQMLLWHAYTWLWFMAGVLALYGIGREMGFSRGVSCMGSLLLYLCPRFFAEGHYNNKDVVLLCLMLLTLWAGVVFLKKITLGRGLLLSLLGALAANTKIVGAMAWGLMGVAAAALLTLRREWNLRKAVTALVTIFSFVLFYILLTPAMLRDVPAYLSYLLENATGFTRWPGVVLFRDYKYEHAICPLPRYYLPWMMAVTLPLYVLPLAAVGQITALRDAIRMKSSFWKETRGLMLGVATLCWAVPMGAAILLRPLIYNGWRHFYFVYAGVAVMGANGLQVCCARIKKPVWKRVFTIVLCLCFALSGVGITQNHPYEYAYYNLLQRGDTAREMELDYWDVSTLNLLEQLARECGDEDAPLEIGARDDMSQFGIDHAYTVLSEELQEKLTVTENPDAPWLFYNTTYARIYEIPAPEGYHEWRTLYSYGQPICTLWQKDEP